MSSLIANALKIPLSNNSVDLTVTSPPYFMQVIYRDKNKDPISDQLGLESTPTEYIDNLMAVMEELKRVSKPSASIFVNLGDKFCGYTNGAGKPRSHGGARGSLAKTPDGPKSAPSVYGIPNKSLMALPQRLTIRCIDELNLVFRSEIIWQKYQETSTNLSDNKSKDRFRRDHEVWLHFTLKSKYYFNDFSSEEVNSSVQSVKPQRCKTHPAVFPEEWPQRFVQGWSPEGGIVLDPFSGSGTVPRVATRLNRKGIGLDLYDYIKEGK